MMKRPVIVAVSGFTSEVGKTTLMCDLLRAFPGWEAIKMTRGHYRSCGKDPHACCVSHLLSDEPVIRSGREQTYAFGKDTGRYWDAGAANVHWVIVTDGQVKQGITRALERVSAPGVLIEGNSFVDFISADFVVMVSRTSGGKIKARPGGRFPILRRFIYPVSQRKEVVSDANLPCGGKNRACTSLLVISQSTRERICQSLSRGCKK